MLFVNQSGLIRTLIFLMGERDEENEHKLKHNHHGKNSEENHEKINTKALHETHEHNHMYFNEEMFTIDQKNHRITEEIEEYKRNLTLSTEKKNKYKAISRVTDSKIITERKREMDEMEKKFINTDLLLSTLQFRPSLSEKLPESHILAYKKNFLDLQSKFIVKTKRQKKVLFGILSEKIVDRYKFCKKMNKFISN